MEVWKLSDFPATLFLREINFTLFQKIKSSHFTNFQGSNFDFWKNRFRVKSELQKHPEFPHCVQILGKKSHEIAYLVTDFFFTFFTHFHEKKALLEGERFTNFYFSIQFDYQILIWFVLFVFWSKSAPARRTSARHAIFRETKYHATFLQKTIKTAFTRYLLK